MSARTKRMKSKSVVGIDIADHTLSIVELQKYRNNPRVSSVARVAIPPGILARGRIRDTEKLQELFEYALAKADPAPISGRIAIMGIPDSQLYTHLARLPKQKDNELDKSALEEALRTFPVEKRDLIYAYRVVSHSDEGTDILLIAASKEVLREWDLFFHRLGITVPFYDSEVLATARGLTTRTLDDAFCLVDIGAASTTVSVFDAKGIRYVHSIGNAGSALTESIAKIESLPFDEAQKRKHDLDLSDIPTSLAGILPSFFDPAIAEINTAIQYVLHAYDITVKKIILVGGTSALKGLPEYMHDAIGIETLRGKPIIGIGKDDEHGVQSSREEPSIESVGLALHGLNAHEYEHEPKLQSSPEEIRQSEEDGKRDAPQAYDANAGQMKEFHDIRKEQRRMRRQIAVLVMVLTVGAILIAAAFWYQRAEQERKESSIHKLTNPD
ncbi:pilus assembly protein PilM [Candidatus Uhrbacteria bacterium]|nr:pilus assembly protein PilM [Candidatus Uhrbacteria bacterium]